MEGSLFSSLANPTPIPLLSVQHLPQMRNHILTPIVNSDRIRHHGKIETYSGADLATGTVLPSSPHYFSCCQPPDEVKWSRVNIPTEGKAGNWVLASGSDVAHLALAIDGTLYAYVKGFTYTLYKSTDEGSSWSYIGGITEAIVDIATTPSDASIIYYATM